MIVVLNIFDLVPQARVTVPIHPHSLRPTLDLLTTTQYYHILRRKIRTLLFDDAENNFILRFGDSHRARCFDLRFGTDGGDGDGTRSTTGGGESSSSGGGKWNRDRRTSEVEGETVDDHDDE